MNISLEIDHFAAEAARDWNLSFRRNRRDLQIAGSPDRCELRLVIECDSDRLYVLESLFEADADHKLEIITCLNFLSEKGLKAVSPYLRSTSGGYIVNSGSRLWQLSPFVPGVPLVRPAYVWDGWRGEVMADFLIRLNTLSRNISCLKNLSAFSITDYIQKLVAQIQTHAPDVLDGIRPVVRFVEERFIKAHDLLPLSFCHGDFHPLNVIWSPNGIHAVIDWEFLGIKPEIYDAANLIGCIGIEDPQALLGDLVRNFILRLKQSKWISNASWNVLIEFVIAIRFAWLSEWLRHDDREMIALETLYMNILTDNADMLKKMLIKQEPHDETM
jgi:homoserine kinase type II